MNISREAVIWSYRLFLDREPENEDIISKWLNLVGSNLELRRAFLQSQEYEARNPVSGRLPTLSGHEPEMQIKEVHSEMELQALFDHIQNSWQHLGEAEPFWSVVTSESYLQNNLHAPGVKDGFYQSGTNDLARISRILQRNGIDVGRFESCLEYGCGVGRVTGWLARKFPKVYACDVSRSHMQIADEYLRAAGISNVTMKHVKSPRDLADLPRVDFIYSVLVLQHNPPPVIASILKNLIRTLNPGGAIIFQLPTYRLNYRFSLHDYLGNEGKKREMEMHVLSQKRIFEIIDQEGGLPLEVIEDNYTGFRNKELSNTFLASKK